jgi:hypothetical protein
MQGCIESPPSPMTNFCNNKVKSGMALESKSKIQPGKTSGVGRGPRVKAQGDSPIEGSSLRKSPERKPTCVCTGRVRSKDNQGVAE